MNPKKLTALRKFLPLMNLFQRAKFDLFWNALFERATARGFGVRFGVGGFTFLETGFWQLAEFDKLVGLHLEKPSDGPQSCDLRINLAG